VDTSMDTYNMKAVYECDESDQSHMQNGNCLNTSITPERGG